MPRRMEGKEAPAHDYRPDPHHHAGDAHVSRLRRPLHQAHRLPDPGRVPGDPVDHRLPHRYPHGRPVPHASPGSTLEVLPASQFCGRAVVLDVSDLPPRSVITADYLREQNGTIRSADFVLFYTGWERKWGTGAYYDDDFPVPDQEAAKYLVSCGLKGVGTDALSVDTLRDQQFLAHKTLLDGGLVILESLCLKKVVGRTDLMLFALPLKFENADGAPVRAIAEFRDFPEEKEMEAL